MQDFQARAHGHKRACGCVVIWWRVRTGAAATIRQVEELTEQLAEYEALFIKLVAVAAAALVIAVFVLPSLMVMVAKGLVRQPLAC